MWWGCCAVYAVCAVVGSHEVVCALLAEQESKNSI